MRPHPEAIVLGNGRFASLVSDAGGGGTVLGPLAVTRWIPDATQDAQGQFLFVRDLESGEYWSAAAQPVSAAGVRHDVTFRPGVAALSAVRGETEITTAICVAPDDDVELRRHTLVNRGVTPKHLELTTYAELALNTPAGDMGHPAFSKLFVQTRHDAARGALVAWRRLRSPDDQPLVVAQTLFDPASAEPASYDTDRMRFVGRGRTLARPLAMDRSGALPATVGNVLDPVFALRRSIDLEPGQTVRLVSILSASRDERALEIISRYSSLELVDRVFEKAAAHATRRVNACGVAARWDRVPRATGALAYAVANSEVAGVGLPTLADDTRLFELLEPLLGEAHTERRLARSRMPRQAVSRGERAAPRAPERESNDLAGFNGYGGFTPEGDEYVIRIERDGDGLRLPPLPWSNVVANEDAGFIATETGAGYTWTVNSRENRLTPWFNDPVCDPHGEALWVRDEDTGAYWSPVPGPTPGDGGYEARHGLGYSRWRHESNGLEQETWMFVPRRDPLKIVRLTLTNASVVRRRLAIYSYAHWVLGVLPHETARSVRTEHDSATGALFAHNDARGELSRRTAFAALVVPGARITSTGDRCAFLGTRGSVTDPAAVSSGEPLDGRTGQGLDPCAAFRAAFTLEPGETVECLVLVGEAADDARARDIVRRYRLAGSAGAALDDVRAFWRELVSGVRIETPSPALNAMVNWWLPYQNLSCRVWGRSAYYQSGGAFGFRDQLQDAAALLYLDPGITRRQILLHAAHQFVEGDVLHWWHPPASKGIRTRFSDDLLWLPFVTTFYVGATGDDAVLDESVRYVRARALAPGEDEAFLAPEDAAVLGTIYEHCCRAIDRSLTRGAHGLPLMGTGDWNDGMNRVGREGRGESVWLGFFLHEILRGFIPICEERGDTQRAAKYEEFRTDLRRALNAEDGGWDGEWYRRAYYDDGAPLGSKSSDECRIDVIAQAWSVLSGAAPAERAHRALDAMERYLVSEQEGISRLLTPAFDQTPHDPGYIKGYLPGVRENGGQYTHGALWAVRALAELGREERAARLLAMLSPVSHGSTRASADVYMAEPYVIAADVYGVSPHVGRAGWTWYTGSAGWMYRVALESVLGFELVGGRRLELRPCIPRDWPGFSVRYRLPASRTTYELRVCRADVGRGTSVAGERSVPARVENGAVVTDLVNDGQSHVVEIAIGPDVGRLYMGPDDVGA